MKKGTGKLLKTYYYILNQILERISASGVENKAKLNEIFKSWYKRQTSIKHSSLRHYNKDELHNLINRILIEFSVEYGIYLKQPGDPYNAEQISLSEYLEYNSWKMEEVNDLFPVYEEVPEGYNLIKSIDDLMRLKQGKKKSKPENLELSYGTSVFVHSPTIQRFYKKILSTFTPLELLEDYIKKELVYGPILTDDE